MSDLPPTVDFSTPYDPLRDLAYQRKRLQSLIRDIDSSMADVRGFDAEAARNVGIAATWG